MNYRISYYDTTLLALKKWRNRDGECTETFATEDEALRRARELSRQARCTVSFSPTIRARRSAASGCN